MKNLTPHIRGVSILLLFALFALGSGKSTSSSRPAPRLPSVAQWKRDAGVEGYAGQWALNGVSPSTLFSRVGNADSRQEVGDSIYLYWQCSDGRIQLSVDRMNYGFGQVIVQGLNVY